MSDIQRQLRLKGRVDLGDVIVEYGGEWMLLSVGDTYIAETEGEEAEVLTVRKVEVQRRSSGLTTGKVFPKERKKKLYDLHECVKVRIISNPNPPKKEQEDERPRPVAVESGRVEQADVATSRPDRSLPRDPRREGGKTDYSRKHLRPGESDGARGGVSER